MSNRRPTLTGSGGVDERRGRIRRLSCVEGFLCACDDGILDRIAHMSDTKGELTVWWRRPPDLRDRTLVMAAWMSRVGDGSDLVTHKIDGLAP